MFALLASQENHDGADLHARQGFATEETGAVFGLTVYLTKATLERTFQFVKAWRAARRQVLSGADRA